MRNECLKLIGDDVMRYKDGLNIYTQNENYTIWTDDNYLCYIQMTGGEIESKAYDIASEAIEEAEGRR